MLRRDLRDIWNAGSPSAAEKEACLDMLLEQRPKDEKIRGLRWRPKGQVGPWLLIVLVILAVGVSVYYLADFYGVTDYIGGLIAAAVPTETSADDATEPSATEDIPTQTEEQQLSYKPLAAKYVQAIAEDWDMVRCEEEDISYLVMFLDKPEDLSCSVTDLDGNGVKEMIVTDGNLIYDMYTCSGGDYVHILSSAERDSFTLTENNEIVNVRSGSASYTVYRMYLYYGTNLIPIELILCDASRDPSAPWFRGIDDPENVSPISEKEARAIIDRYPAIPIKSSVITLFD